MSSDLLYHRSMTSVHKCHWLGPLTWMLESCRSLTLASLLSSPPFLLPWSASSVSLQPSVYVSLPSVGPKDEILVSFKVCLIEASDGVCGSIWKAQVTSIESFLRRAFFLITWTFRVCFNPLIRIRLSFQLQRQLTARPGVPFALIQRFQREKPAEIQRWVTKHVPYLPK